MNVRVCFHLDYGFLKWNKFDSCRFAIQQVLTRIHISGACDCDRMGPRPDDDAMYLHGILVSPLTDA